MTPTSSDEHHARLALVVEDLISAYSEYSTCWAAEKLQRAHQVRASLNAGTGPSATEQWAFVATVNLAAETLKVGQEIKALECERDHLMFLIAHSTF